MGLWGIVATSGASLAAGVICLLLLVIKGKHRSADGTISRVNIANSVMLTASLYTMLVLVMGEMFFGQQVSATIKDGFGNGRTAWLLVALALDTGHRVLALFD